jgi:hypothetical protein
MAATIKNRYPGLYSIPSSIEEDSCAAEIRTLWEAKRGHPVYFEASTYSVPEVG